MWICVCVCVCVENLGEIEICVTDVYWTHSEGCDCDSVPVISASGKGNRRSKLSPVRETCC